MAHFYVCPEDVSGKRFKIYGEYAHYVGNVRRFKTGDEIMLFDGRGNSYRARVSNMLKNEISGDILEAFFKMPEFRLCLFCALAKGTRFEWLVEKCAEIGVCCIIPISTRRSGVETLSQNKLKRLKKISISASSQCGRNDILEICDIQDFRESCLNAFKALHFENVLLWESEEKNKTLRSLLENKNKKGVNAFIGPEGGFESDEVELAKSLNFKTASLGKNILRIETAAICASALILDAMSSCE
ncbi:MAG: 16S rRNA (uracil(1498)-N(3))-methyltransferase [Elusimicrobiota bacterium]|jgi:16S rRNA (uracil1498-N3)-methyltransferase|nr:16S rRNA (uracil(1498)-N(3))-methyltransferase [Elusimicrobiota bacterium]